MWKFWSKKKPIQEIYNSEFAKFKLELPELPDVTMTVIWWGGDDAPEQRKLTGKRPNFISHDGLYHFQVDDGMKFCIAQSRLISVEFE